VAVGEKGCLRAALFAFAPLGWLGRLLGLRQIMACNGQMMLPLQCLQIGKTVVFSQDWSLP